MSSPIEVEVSFKIAAYDRVLLSGKEFEKLLLSNVRQALLAAILLLAVVMGTFRNPL